MKKIIFLLSSFLLVVGFALTVKASTDRIVDNAGLLTFQQEAALEQQLEEVSNAHSIDVVIVTTRSLEGKTAQAYADDYYEQNGYKEDGVLLLVSMGYRDWSVSTSGTCIRAFGDSALDAIEEEVITCLSRGDYGEAFSRFIELCGSTMKAYEAGPSGIAIVICIAVGVIVAFIATGVMKGQLKTVRAQADARSYVSPGSLQLTKHLDLFLYRNVSRRPRPQSNSSGSHQSSSGRSHGGRSGKF